MLDPTSIRLDPRLASRVAEKKARLDQYRPLPQIAAQTSYSTNYLGLLIRQGRIAGEKRDGR